MKKIESHLPIENIFKWIYIEMKEHKELSYENYCIALSLLDELQVTYSKNREVITFDVCDLSIPIAKVKNILKEKL